MHALKLIVSRAGEGGDHDIAHRLMNALMPGGRDLLLHIEPFLTQFNTLACEAQATDRGYKSLLEEKLSKFIPSVFDAFSMLDAEQRTKARLKAVLDNKIRLEKQRRKLAKTTEETARSAETPAVDGAAGTRCEYCNKPHHDISVCRKKKSDERRKTKGDGKGSGEPKPYAHDGEGSKSRWCRFGPSRPP